MMHFGEWPRVLPKIMCHGVLERDAMVKDKNGSRSSECVEAQ